MSSSWGLETANRRSQREKGPKRPIEPHVAQQGHKGIVWIHAAGIFIWLLTAGILGVLWLLGREVPGALIIAGFLAALGHASFVAVHLYLARAAASRASGTRQK